MTTPNEPIAWRWRRIHGECQPGAWNLVTHRAQVPHPVAAERVECEPLYAAAPVAATECLLAVEYCANHIEDWDERAEFVTELAEYDTDEFLVRWEAYAAWRAERLAK